MDGVVTRVLYPRPDRPQDGWISFVERTSGSHLKWVATDSQRRTSEALEGVFQRRRARMLYPRPDYPQDGWTSYVERTSGAQIKWVATDALRRTSDSIEFVLWANRER